MNNTQFKTVFSHPGQDPKMFEGKVQDLLDQGYSLLNTDVKEGYSHAFLIRDDNQLHERLIADIEQDNVYSILLDTTEVVECTESGFFKENHCIWNIESISIKNNLIICKCKHDKGLSCFPVTTVLWYKSKEVK